MSRKKHRQDLLPDEITIVNWDHGTAFGYRYFCIGCESAPFKWSNNSAVVVLNGWGVEVQHIKWSEQEGVYGDPPISHDDLIDFHEKMNNQQLIRKNVFY